ncbi:MAG: pantoate--beta-alanine ligase [Rhodovibrionaceae bacterium]
MMETPAPNPGSDAPLRILRSVAELRAIGNDWRRAGESIGLVPTMGGLHDGHLELVRRARAENDRVIATIFVNPRQFDRADDLKSYPRDEARDARLLAEIGTDLLFAPDVTEVYPEDFRTRVIVDGLTKCMDGVHRPGHFEGVATVVCKLLLQALPDRAYFGEKDFQQLLVVSQLVRDLNIPAEIVPVATVRSPDGLALASRNVYLTEEERRIAPLLHGTMQEVAADLRDGAPALPLILSATSTWLRAGFRGIDYFDLRDAENLASLDALSNRPARLLVAAWLGKVRLIDNIGVAA